MPATTTTAGGNVQPTNNVNKPIPVHEPESFIKQLLTNRFVIGSLFSFFLLSFPRISEQWNSYMTSDNYGSNVSPSHPSFHSNLPQKYNCTIDQSTPLVLAPSAGVRVLVTGAAGFIGSHVAAYASDVLHMDVIAVDDMSGGFDANISPHVTFVKGDLKDDQFIELLFRQYGPFEHVYHLAAYAAEGMSHFIRKFNYRNNLVTSVALLNEAVRSNVSTFVFTSSIAAYGAAQTPMIETTTPEPEDPYGISKYAFELDLKSAKHMFGLDYIIYRPHNVYGPNQNIYDRYRNVIGIFIQQILSDKPMTIFGDGKQTRAFSYIDDVAPVIAMGPLVKQARNEIFNVGADQPYTLNELADTVAKHMNVSKNVKYLDARKEVVHAESDHSKVRCIFKLKEPVDLDTGIKHMTEWVMKTGKLFEPVEFDEVEVLRGMPPSWINENMKKNEQKRLDSLAKRHQNTKLESSNSNNKQQNNQNKDEL